MTHMVFMKFEEGFFNDAVLSEISAAFDKLRLQLPAEIKGVRVMKNCVAREANMDILIEMKLRSEESLGIYLAHPVHVGIGEIMNPHVVSRCSFDCRDGDGE